MDHHALDVQVLRLPILVLPNVPVQLAHTGVEHPVFNVQLAHSGVEVHVSLVQARLLLIEDLLIAPVQWAHTGAEHHVTVAPRVQQVKAGLSSVSHVLHAPDH